MTEALEQVYDALLLDHIRSARNYGLEASGPAALEISNPLCGDVLQLQLVIAGDCLQQLRFECECCGIAMGNASLMTEAVQGQALATVRALADQALRLLAGEAGESAPSLPLPGQTGALLRAVRRTLPGRRTCASLGWQALQAALDGARALTAREIRG